MLLGIFIIAIWQSGLFLDGLRVRLLETVDHLGTALTGVVNQVPYWLGSRVLMNVLRARWLDSLRNLFESSSSVSSNPEEAGPSLEDRDPFCNDPTSFGVCGDFSDKPSGGAAILATVAASIPVIWPLRVILLRRLLGLRG